MFSELAEAVDTQRKKTENQIFVLIGARYYHLLSD